MPIELKLLLLILIANGVPLVAASLCGDWGARPLDGGRTLADKVELSFSIRIVEAAPGAAKS